MSRDRIVDENTLQDLLDTPERDRSKGLLARVRTDGDQRLWARNEPGNARRPKGPAQRI